MSGPGAGGRRRWWRWLLAGVVLLVVIVVAGAALFVKSQPSAAPLTLPSGTARPPTGPADGTWDAAAGSVAGFRIRESVLGFGDEVAGRTTVVTGTAAIAGDQLTSAVFRVGLTAITVGGKSRPQIAASLDTAAHPGATITLAGPVRLPAGFGLGRTVTAVLPGQLTLRGVTRPVTITVSARRDGATVEVAGSLPVASARWGIALPAGFGFLGGLSSEATGEFLLVLHRRW
ncbi:MAG TPA: YceI family protein [Trebonia sp.]